MRCPEAREQVWLRVAGEADPASAADLERHLSGCAACAALAGEAGKVHGEIESAFREAAPRPELADRIVGSLRGMTPARRPVLRFRLLAAAAAAVLAAFLLRPWIKQPPWPKAEIAAIPRSQEWLAQARRAAETGGDPRQAAERALEGFCRELALRPDDPAALTGRAEALILLGDAEALDQAMADLGRVLELGAADARAFIAMGTARAWRADQAPKRHEELARGAVEAFTEALRRDPDSAEARVGRAAAYQRLGLAREAADDLSALAGKGQVLSVELRRLHLDRVPEARMRRVPLGTGK